MHSRTQGQRMLHDPSLSRAQVPGRETASSHQRYVVPHDPKAIELGSLMRYCDRPLDDARSDLFRKAGEAEPIIYYAGDLSLLKLKAVSVIGAREASAEGVARASRIAKELARADIIVTSGLARGIDQAAHSAAIAAGGSTVAVIGTPLDKAYPAENAALQTTIWQEHLLISQFRPGQRTYPSDFPKRNRLMAALTDASIIVEASDTSGTLHQAAECLRLGRWLFIMRSVAEDPKLGWPKKFIGNERVAVLTDPDDVISRLSA